MEIRRQRLIQGLVGIFACMITTGLFVPTTLAQQWEEAYPGVRYLAETRQGPVEVRAVEVDLCASGVSLRATAEDENWQTTSSFGSEVEAQVAVNGDFYEWPPDALGLAVGDGDNWSPDTPEWGFVAFGPGEAEISPPGEHVDEPADWKQEAVGGNIMVVTDGVVTDDQGEFCTTRHPRTVAGLSEDGATLILAVADGRSDQSVGLTCAELGELMTDLGAHQALNLDGGGSTTMWLEGKGVVNAPSEGQERTVLNHLAVRADGEGKSHSCPLDRDAIPGEGDGAADAGGDDEAEDDSESDDDTSGDSEAMDESTTDRELTTSSGCAVSGGQIPNLPALVGLVVALGIGVRTIGNWRVGTRRRCRRSSACDEPYPARIRSERGRFDGPARWYRGYPSRR